MASRTIWCALLPGFARRFLRRFPGLFRGRFFFLWRIGAKDDADMADGMNLLGAKPGAQLLRHLFAKFALDARQADFDQFMVVQRAFGLREDSLTQSGVTDHNHRFKRVRAGAQFFSLCRCHRFARRLSVDLRRRAPALPALGRRVSRICA